jgi:predicted metal-dependent peptidase
MMERHLPEEMVIDAVERPQQVLEVSKGRKVAQKTFSKGGRDFLLRVIFSEKANRREVITVYLTSKVSKYWR